MESRIVSGRTKRGFTLVELLVVMAIIATLLTLVTPRYFAHVERAKEAVLRENLATVRDAIDKYHADTNTWPADLQALADKHYIRGVPKDPITDKTDTWVLVPPADGGDGVYDLHSGATGDGQDGTAFGDW
jgi:general secretion pathway protein G